MNYFKDECSYKYKITANFNILQIKFDLKPQKLIFPFYWGKVYNKRMKLIFNISYNKTKIYNFF
jgi:hypothetical protein